MITKARLEDIRKNNEDRLSRLTPMPVGIEIKYLLAHIDDQERRLRIALDVLDHLSQLQGPHHRSSVGWAGHTARNALRELRRDRNEL